MGGSNPWLDIAPTRGALVDAEERSVPANVTRDRVGHVLVAATWATPLSRSCCAR